MLTFKFAKEQTISERQYNSIREMVRKLVSLFSNRTGAAKMGLRKVHEFGWSNKTREIPQHRYRNALMAISMLKSNATYAALNITSCGPPFDALGLFKESRAHEKEPTMDEICDELIANGDMEAPEALVARMRGQDKGADVELWNFRRYRWRHICASWQDEGIYPGELGFDCRAEREWKKMFGEAEIAPSPARHLKLVYSRD